MSQAQTPNTPRANNNNTIATDEIPPPSQAASRPLSPSAAHPDLPRRSSSPSLHSSSPGALNGKKADDNMSIQQRHSDDGAGQGGNGLSGEGQGEEDTGSVGGKNNSSMEDARERVEEFDWEGLEGRFWDRMDECKRVEEGLREDFEEAIKVFNAWATAGSVGEEDRAAKRLRTRMTFVQQREETLEEKRLHYLKVVQAFESALALLSAT